MSFGSRYGREVVRCFIKDTKERHGVEVNEEELNALAEAGKIEIDTYGMIPDEDRRRSSNGLRWAGLTLPLGENALYLKHQSRTPLSPLRDLEGLRETPVIVFSNSHKN